MSVEEESPQMCLNCKVDDTEIPPPQVKRSSKKAAAKSDKDTDDNTMGEFAESTEEVPEWSKRVGNYSPYPKFLTCDKDYSLENRDNLEEKSPTLGDNPISLELSLGSENKNAWVVAWASTSSEDPMEIQAPGKAYQDDINHAMKQTDEKGKVSVKLNCPQPYEVDGITYCRHVHYVIENRDEHVWMPMKTKRVVCQISIDALDTVLKEKTGMVINSLPKEMYEKDKIPNTVNLPRETLDKLSTKEKEKRVTEFLESNLSKYPPIESAVREKKLKLTDIPIVVYCMNDTCKSAGRLLQHLYEVGVNNVLEFGPGVQGWSSQRVMFDDDDLQSDDDDSDEDAEEQEDVEEDSPETPDDDDDERDSSDYISIAFEGVDYLLDPKTNKVYNDMLDEVGTATMVGKKCKKIDWLNDSKKKQHIRERDGTPETDEENDDEENDDEDDDDEDEDEDEDEDDDEDEDEDEDDDDDDEDEDEDEDDDEDEDEDEDEEQESVEKDLYTYTEQDLQDMKLPQLKSLVKQINERPGSTVMFPLGSKGLKTREEIIGLISGCQGKHTKVKSQFEFLSLDELRKKPLAELKLMVKKMTDRQPDEFKTESSYHRWSKGRLVGYILSCRGKPLSQSGQGYRKRAPRGFGWGYTLKS
jgi:hypothetical protein